jgi:hypothetical protein
MKVRKRDHGFGVFGDAILPPRRVNSGSQIPRGTHFGRLGH